MIDVLRYHPIFLNVINSVIFYFDLKNNTQRAVFGPRKVTVSIISDNLPNLLSINELEKGLSFRTRFNLIMF